MLAGIWTVVGSTRLLGISQPIKTLMTVLITRHGLYLQRNSSKERKRGGRGCQPGFAGCKTEWECKKESLGSQGHGGKPAVSTLGLRALKWGPCY